MVRLPAKRPFNTRKSIRFLSPLSPFFFFIIILLLLVKYVIGNSSIFHLRAKFWLKNKLSMLTVLLKRRQLFQEAVLNIRIIISELAKTLSCFVFPPGASYLRLLFYFGLTGGGALGG